MESNSRYSENKENKVGQFCEPISCTKEVDVLNGAIELEAIHKSIVEASKAFIDGKFDVSASKYRKILVLLTKLHKEYDVSKKYVIQYMFCVSLSESNRLEDLEVALEYLLEMEKKIEQNSPAIYYALATIHMKFFRFDYAQKTINNAFAFLNNEIQFYPFSIPGTNCIIRESTKDGLMTALFQLNEVCSAWHRPNAICCLINCQDSNQYYSANRNIFYSNPRFSGMITVTCSKSMNPCIKKFHKSCWIYQKAQISKNINLSDKDVIGLKCLSSNCMTNKVAKIEIMNKDQSIEIVKMEMQNMSSSLQPETPMTGAVKKHSQEPENTNITERSPFQEMMNKQNLSLHEGCKTDPNIATSKFRKLILLRRNNFGIDLKDNWLPSEKMYGNPGITGSQEFLAEPEFSNDAQSKLFVFGILYEYIKTKGPLTNAEVLVKWEETKLILEDCNTNTEEYTDIIELLLQSSKIAMIDCYLCVPEMLPKVYALLKMKTTEDFRKIFGDETNSEKNIQALANDFNKNIKPTEEIIKDVIKLEKSLVRSVIKDPLMSNEHEDISLPCDAENGAKCDALVNSSNVEFDFQSQCVKATKENDKLQLKIDAGSTNPFKKSLDEIKLNVLESDKFDKITEEFSSLLETSKSQTFNPSVTFTSLSKEDGRSFNSDFTQDKQNTLIQQLKLPLKEKIENIKVLIAQGQTLSKSLKNFQSLSQNILEHNNVLQVQYLNLEEEINTLWKEKYDFENPLYKKIETYQTQLLMKNIELETMKLELFNTKKKLFRKILDTQYSANTYFLLRNLERCNFSIEIINYLNYIMKKKFGYNNISPDLQDWIKALSSFQEISKQHEVEYTKIVASLELKEEVEQRTDINLPSIKALPAMPKKTLFQIIEEAFKDHAVENHRSEQQYFKKQNPFATHASSPHSLIPVFNAGRPCTPAYIDPVTSNSLHSIEPEKRQNELLEKNEESNEGTEISTNTEMVNVEEKTDVIIYAVENGVMMLEENFKEPPEIADNNERVPEAHDVTEDQEEIVQEIPRNVVLPEKLCCTNLDKLMFKLRDTYFGIMDFDILQSLIKVRQDHGNSLSGMSVKEIVEEAGEYILQFQKKYLCLNSIETSDNNEATTCMQDAKKTVKVTLKQIPVHKMKPLQQCSSNYKSKKAVLRAQNLNATIALKNRSIYPLLTSSDLQKAQQSTIAASSAKKTWSLLPKDNEKWNKENQESECIICMEELCYERTVYTLMCKHTFHLKCIRNWFRQNRSCPTCRAHCTIDDEFPPLPC